jgi:hypothetical protein
MPRGKKKVQNGVKDHAKPVAAPPAPPPPPKVSYRDLKWAMEAEIQEFRDQMVEKYRDFHGQDMRKEVAWYMEQMGLSISSDLERAKREERQKAIADRAAAEAAAAAPAEK